MQGLLSKFAKFSNKQLTNSIRRFAGNHHHHAGDQADRVADKIIWINIQNRIGQFERISAFEGESLLEALQRNKVAGILLVKVVKILILCQKNLSTLSLMVLSAALVKQSFPIPGEPRWVNCIILKKETFLEALIPLLKSKDILIHDSNLQREVIKFTRLACCVLVEKWMNEMIISIPQNPNSVYEDNM